MDHQPTYPATPTMAQDNHNRIVCPSTPQSRKPSIMFDGMNVVLPFQIQLSSESDTSVGCREVIFSLKPRSNFTRTETDGATTKVAIDSFPPLPFGCTQRQEVVKPSSNPSKLPSQVRPRSFTQAKQRHTFNARCA
uniref:Uncharacterized protein n=1 Tax=Skeletonema marinoi TaxID=267567 RepID=A0A7S2PWJ6_9STRA|mmetsp:Transcript_32930/g.55811  ORF Transcript_32930/g.55811 Transcript_32930/m.55811 type:complete len:136 (+) Transcript_32930:294-701(+)